MLNWTLLICSCCDARLPMIILCKDCRDCKDKDIGEIPILIPNQTPQDHRHRLLQGKGWARTRFECSSCGTILEETVLCAGCAKEGSDIMKRAQQIRTEAGLVN